MTTTSQPFSLAGRVAFIPGGYGDIGRAVAWQLARAGASVAVAGRDAAKAEALAAKIAQAGHAALGFALDVKDSAQIRAGTERVASHFGALDLLVNCVGMQRERAPGRCDRSGVRRDRAVNLRAAMFLAQAASHWQVAAVRPGARRAARSMCCRCARSSACATAAIRPTARPRVDS